LFRLRKKTAGLPEMFKLYLFVKSLPSLVAILTRFTQNIDEDDEPSNTEQNTEPKSEEDDDEEESTSHHSQLCKPLKEKYLLLLSQILNKFSLYEQLIEHILDFSVLPEYKINPIHDEDLQELANESKELERKAEKLLSDAKSSYASGFDIRLDFSLSGTNHSHGICFRSTKGKLSRSCFIVSCVMFLSLPLFCDHSSFCLL
jgi:hypothetical protein